MNVLIIGLGSIGKRHLRNILEHREEWGIERVSVFDTNPQAREGAVNRGYGFLSDTAHLSSASFDAAIICTPPKFHYEYAILTRPAHVLVEKPLTYAMPWEDEQAKDRLVLAAMNLRFHKSVEWVRGQIAGGAMGAPSLAKAWYSYKGVLDRPNSPDAQTGPVTSAIHDLDALLWALGGAVDAPIARRFKTIIDQVERSKKWGLAFGKAMYGRLPEAGGSVRADIRLDADFLAHVRRRGMHIIGTEGEVLTEATGVGREHVVRIVNGRLEWEGTNEINDMYAAELAEFFALCRGDMGREESRLPDVVEVLKLAETMEVSV